MTIEIGNAQGPFKTRTITIDGDHFGTVRSVAPRGYMISSRKAVFSTPPWKGLTNKKSAKSLAEVRQILRSLCT